MNPIAKKLWLKALPKYTQGKRWMRRNGRYCCLGVLQECALKADVEFAPEWGLGSLPQKIKDWSELTYGDQWSLAERNDAGDTFEEIALMIENGL